MQQANDDDEILGRGRRKLWQSEPKRDAHRHLPNHLRKSASSAVPFTLDESTLATNDWKRCGACVKRRGAGFLVAKRRKIRLLDWNHASTLGNRRRGVKSHSRNVEASSPMHGTLLYLSALSARSRFYNTRSSRAVPTQRMQLNGQAQQSKPRGVSNGRPGTKMRTPRASNQRPTAKMRRLRARTESPRA
jgi:hypothetical protein